MILQGIDMMEKTKIEGRLEIWYDCVAAEKTDYRLVFVPYAKRIKPLSRILTGDYELENFLVTTALEADAARAWLKDVRTFTSVSIDNVFLPEEFFELKPQSGPNFRNRLSAFLHTMRLYSKRK
jgi:hypothetical protein